MRKIIGKHTYDTENAVLIHKYTYGHWGDPTGFEEALFQTPAGMYFLYRNGGQDSPYSTESIVRIAKNKICSWVEAH